MLKVISNVCEAIHANAVFGGSHLELVLDTTFVLRVQERPRTFGAGGTEDEMEWTLWIHWARGFSAAL